MSRARARSLDHTELADTLAEMIGRDGSGEVTVRWFTKDGDLHVEIAHVVRVRQVTQESLLDRARAVDAKWLTAKGRHISAERLARELRVGKTRALALVREIRADAGARRKGGA